LNSPTKQSITNLHDRDLGRTEVARTKEMLEHAEENLGLKPDRLMADTAYGTAEMLGWLVEEKQIAPHIPVWDRTDGKPGLFSRSDFTWHTDKNGYICPAG